MAPAKAWASREHLFLACFIEKRSNLLPLTTPLKAWASRKHLFLACFIEKRSNLLPFLNSKLKKNDSCNHTISKVRIRPTPNLSLICCLPKAKSTNTHALLQLSISLHYQINNSLYIFI
ncbi:hypothetical protein BZG02_02985 [Labilibaculum filiforme]|uniref:Uncharacterized protein n=1 Tax=Labilibaculum filiforme TaxID=1940526 RepID=A0A2N3I3E9_9BACT|nr:hypothetical protein BZG02_02985 [Labilibaculum filiforme]